MIFSSPTFLFVFLPLLFIVYVFIPSRLRNLVLLIFSLAFYYWGSGHLVILLLFSIVSNYFFGLQINGPAKKNRTFWFVIALASNIGLLFYFKYVNFLVEELNKLFETFNIPFIQKTDIILPIGISFFTFQALSYIIDTYRLRAEAQKNPVEFALYIAMFPQLIAGPIIRFVHISDQIRNRPFSLDMIYSGLCRFIFGLGKKVIIADQLAGIVDTIFRTNPAALSPMAAWFGTLCFGLQIYYDFSAYSDMAIGLGRVFGFTFLENFNYPYIARSITEFWRRWHISLSTWFRDYLYIPMGGNRAPVWKNYLNLLTVFVLCGLWHGASWNFLVWGLFHGMFLMLEKAFLLKTLNRIPSLFNHVYVLFVLLISWVFFRTENFEQTVFYLKKMFFIISTEPTALSVSEYINSESMLSLFLAFFFSMPVINVIRNNPYISALSEKRKVLPELARTGLSLSVLLYSILVLASSNYKPFIYFRF